MAYLDSADMCRRVKLRLNRPTTDSAFTVSTTDDVIYDALTEARARLCLLIASFIPDGMWTVPTALTSSDSGLTYGFGNDADAAAIFALGHFKVYSDRASIPDYPLTEGVDFTVEGTKLRMANNTARTFGDGGPWAQYVAPTNVVTSATQPTIPKVARLAMVSDAARRCAERISDTAKAVEQEDQFDRDWTETLMAVRTQAFGKGGRTLSQRARRWWR